MSPIRWDFCAIVAISIRSTPQIEMHLGEIRTLAEAADALPQINHQKIISGGSNGDRRDRLCSSDIFTEENQQNQV